MADNPIRTRFRRLLLVLAPAALLWLGGLGTARAHISVDLGGTHESRNSDDGLKDAPCGVAGDQRGDNVYTYKPGATINVSIVETISHPGYFRISFDDDGDDDFVIPAGTNGEMGDCAGDPLCGPGNEDFCSNETVLLDNLDPHASAGFGQQETYTWSVTLPNIECDNCTLQIIQVMNDLNFHPAPYPEDDIYYHCIDLVLSNDAPEVTDTPVDNDGIVCNTPSEPEPGPADAGTGDPGTGDAGTGDPGMNDPGMGDAVPPETGTDTEMDEPSEPDAPTGNGASDAGVMGAAGSPSPAEPVESSGSAATADEAAASSDGGCRTTAGAPTTGVLGPTVLALLALVWRRRSARR